MPGAALGDHGGQVAPLEYQESARRSPRMDATT